MTRCFKCGATEIVKGSIERWGEDSSDQLFRPDHLRFLAITMRHGTPLDSETYA